MSALAVLHSPHLSASPYPGFLPVPFSAKSSWGFIVVLFEFGSEVVILQGNLMRMVNAINLVNSLGFGIILIMILLFVQISSL